jgi:hypothetical protein
MTNQRPYPRLRPLHPNTAISSPKLAELERLSTDAIRLSLVPGQRNCLKARPDGTIIDGHHRIHVLRERGVDVDALPREIVLKADL